LKTRTVVFGLLALLFVLATVGCAAPDVAWLADGVSYDSDASSGAAYEAATGEDLTSSSDGGEGDRLIIRNGSLDIVVPDTQTALDSVQVLADQLGGFILRSDVRQYEEGLHAFVQLRVPAESFDEALQSIRDLANEVRYETTTASDVTEEYVDLQSNLRNREATQARLLEYLDAAEDTEAALAVDEHLRRIEAEIEVLKGRIQYLEVSAAMATISVDITPDELAQPIEIGGWHPEGTLREAFQSLVRVLQFLVDALIVIAVLVVPAMIAVAAPVVGTYYVVRAIRRRRSKSG